MSPIPMSSKSFEDSEKHLRAEAKDVDNSPSQNWLTRKLLTLGVEARGLENFSLFSIDELKPISCYRDFPGAFGRQS